MHSLNSAHNCLDYRVHFKLNFNTKKAAIEFYRNILNKYDANTSVNDEDFSYLIDLLNYNSNNKETAANEEIKDEDEDNELLEEIDDIYVDYHPVYKKVKCFYAVFGEGEWLFSYLLAAVSNTNCNSQCLVAVLASSMFIRSSL